jgi:hypothetical protein
MIRAISTGAANQEEKQMRFTKAQIEKLYAVGRVLWHVWATELELTDVAREGVSADEIKKALCAKLGVSEVEGVAAPSARHTTRTGRSTYEVDAFGGMVVQVRRLVNGWTKETGGMTVISAEVDGMAAEATSLSVGWDDGVMVKLVGPGMTLRIDRNFAERRHFAALQGIIGAAFPAVAELFEKEAGALIPADAEPGIPDPELTLEAPRE